MRRREGGGFDGYADLTVTLRFDAYRLPPRKSAHQKAAAPAGVSTRGATASRLSDLSNQKLLLFFFASRESCKCHKQAGQKHHYRSLGRLLSGLRQRCQRNISIIDGGSGSLRRERSQRHVAFID